MGNSCHCSGQENEKLNIYILPFSHLNTQNSAEGEGSKKVQKEGTGRTEVRKERRKDGGN